MPAPPINHPFGCSRSNPDEPARSSPSLHWSARNGWESVDESLAVESPLAIEVSYERGSVPVSKVLAVTMRTPGQDQELALGFLFGETLVARTGDVVECSSRTENARGEKMDTMHVKLARPPREDLQRVSRGIITSAACGLCGRVSLEGLAIRPLAASDTFDRLPCTTLAQLPERLRGFQPLFQQTGGSHGAALCAPSGDVVLAREDVGRHNAVDKLIGAALTRGLKAHDHLLVLSGRASFELVQKASAFELPVIVAVGAPSSLAVRLANSAGITLVGFTRENRLNVYTHAWRLKSDEVAPVAQSADAVHT